MEILSLIDFIRFIVERDKSIASNNKWKSNSEKIEDYSKLIQDIDPKKDKEKLERLLKEAHEPLFRAKYNADIKS